MARKRTAAAEATADAPASDADISLNPAEFDPAIQQQAQAVVQQVADATRLPPENGHAAEHVPHQGHAASVEKKKYVPPENPFGFENIKGATNRVRLLKSETEQDRRNGTGAWVIRFAHNPNEDKGPNGETYSKENPHPVLKMLKQEGYRWGFDEDGKGGWGKRFNGDGYGTDHMEARRVLQKAAEMIGAPVQDRGPIPD